MPGYKKKFVKGRIKKNNGKNGNGRYRRTSYVPVYDKPELKFIDSEIEDSVLKLAWTAHVPATVLCLNAVAQGDGQSNRDGRVYYIHSVMMKVEILSVLDQEGLAPQNDLICRVCLVHDTQTNQAAITPALVMDETGTTKYLAFRNLSYTKRFKVLKDKTIVLRRMYVNDGSINLFSSAPQIQRFEWYHTFKTPLKVICNGTSGQIAVVTDNSLQIIASANTNTELTISYQARCRFSG